MSKAATWMMTVALVLLLSGVLGKSRRQSQENNDGVNNDDRNQQKIGHTHCGSEQAHNQSASIDGRKYAFVNRPRTLLMKTLEIAARLTGKMLQAYRIWQASYLCQTSLKAI